MMASINVMCDNNFKGFGIPTSISNMKLGQGG